MEMPEQTEAQREAVTRMHETEMRRKDEREHELSQGNRKRRRKLEAIRRKQAA